MSQQNTLPIGTELNGEFEIRELLGSGGFANTYLAQDVSLGRDVAIKEFFPSELAIRADDSASISVRSEAHEEQFNWALDRFVKEARTLAKFRHPSVVRVFRVFRTNDTAYIVLEFVHGSNMETWLENLGRRPTQDELDRILEPLLSALDVVHEAGILHRDIKPANIYIRKADQKPVLLDFGAAKTAFANPADQARTTVAVVSRGYSPNEAYASDSRLQGPWTDLYGLAATIYRALNGSAPPEATTRFLEDDCVQLASMPSLLGAYRPDFLTAVDEALAVMPKARPQSVGEWREKLLPASAGGAQGQAGGAGVAGSGEGRSWRPLSDRPSRPSGRPSIPSWPKSFSESQASLQKLFSGVRETAVTAPKIVSTFASRIVSPGTHGSVEPGSGGSSTDRRMVYLGIVLLLGGSAVLANEVLFKNGRSRPDVPSVAAVDKTESSSSTAGTAANREVVLANEARRQAEEEQRRLEAEARRKQAEENARNREAEAARLQAEEDARQREAEAARLKAEEEARQKEAEAARLKAEEDARQKEAEAARLKAEEEARQKEAEAARLKAEEDARQKEAEAARLKAEKEARQKEAEAARLKAEEDARQREAEIARLKEEEEARKREVLQQQAALAEARRLADEERRRLAAEQAEADAKAKAESEKQTKLAALQPPTDGWDRGPYVSRVQTALKKRSCYSGPVDGEVGPTSQALTTFGTKRGSDVRSIDLAKATVGDYENWLTWFDGLGTWSCAPKATPPAKKKYAPKPKKKKYTPKKKSKPKKSKAKKSKPKKKKSGSSYSRGGNNLLRGGR